MPSFTLVSFFSCQPKNSAHNSKMILWVECQCYYFDENDFIVFRIGFFSFSVSYHQKPFWNFRLNRTYSHILSWNHFSKMKLNLIRISNQIKMQFYYFKTYWVGSPFQNLIRLKNCEKNVAENMPCMYKNCLSYIPSQPSVATLRSLYSTTKSSITRREDPFTLKQKYRESTVLR